MRKMPFLSVKVDRDPEGFRCAKEGAIPLFFVPSGISGVELARRSELSISAKRRAYGFSGSYPMDDRP